MLRAMKRNPGLFELRQAIEPIPQCIAFFKQFSSTVQDPPRELILYCIMEYLYSEGFSSTLAMLEQESQIVFSGKAKQIHSDDDIFGGFRAAHSWNMGHGGDFFSSGPSMFGSFFPQSGGGLTAQTRGLGLPGASGAAMGEMMGAGDREGSEPQKPLLSIIVSAAMGQAQNIQALTTPTGELDIEKVKDQLIRTGLITVKNRLHHCSHFLSLRIHSSK